MLKPGRKLLFLALILGVEIAREWYVLRCMGFEPGRFVAWVRGEDEVIDEPDTIRNELMDSGLLRGVEIGAR